MIEGDPSSGLIYNLIDEPRGDSGDGDDHVQAYNFRMYTVQNSNPATMQPLFQPEAYHPAAFEADGSPGQFQTSRQLDFNPGHAGYGGMGSRIRRPVAAAFPSQRGEPAAVYPPEAAIALSMAPLYWSGRRVRR